MVARSLYYCEINIICMVILCILSTVMLKSVNSKKNRLYKYLLAEALIMCVSDMLAGTFKGTSFQASAVILWLSNLFYFISSFALSTTWLLYSLYLLKGRLYKRFFVPVITLTIIISIFFMTAPINGLAFTIDAQNIYHRGPLLSTEFIVLVPGMLIPLILIPFSDSSRRVKFAVGSYSVFPIVAIICQTIVYGITVCQVGTTFSIFLLFLLYQSDVLHDAVAKAEILDDISNTDVLTSLRNRRAYEVRINELQKSETAAAVFADLNGLKKTNDTKGHKAGDVMLCNFAEFLRDYFDDEDIFRISGDEFVILSSDKEKLSSQFEKMSTFVGDIAAIGFSFGAGTDVISVINQAEVSMYKCKSSYYIKSGLNRRSSN